MQCGGFCKTELKTEHLTLVTTQQIEIEKRLIERGRNGKIEYFEILEVKQQVVAGMNFIFKIKIQKDGEECIFVKIFQDLQTNVYLIDVHHNKSVSDELLMNEDFKQDT